MSILGNMDKDDLVENETVNHKNHKKRQINNDLAINATNNNNNINSTSNAVVNHQLSVTNSLITNFVSPDATYNCKQVKYFKIVEYLIKNNLGINNKKTFYLFSKDLILLIINYLLQRHQILYGTGRNQYWSFGIPNDNHSKSIKLSCVQNQNIETKQISMADSFIVFLSFRGEIFVCGKNETVINNEKPILVNYFVDNKLKISMICNCGRNTAYVLLLDASDSATLYGWGKYNPLSLPLINKTNTIVPKKIEYFKNINEKIKQIYCGYDFAIILTKNSRLFINGSDEYFKLLSKTGYKNEWNEILVDTMSNSNSLQLSITKISCCCSTVFILMSDGTLFCAGRNDWGQLGNNTRDDSFSLKASRWFIENNIKILDINCGSNHCIALSQTKKVYTWGFNGYGQIGDGKNGWDKEVFEPYEVKLNVNPNRIKGIIAGSCNNIVLIDKNANDNIIAFVWGLNEDKQLNLFDDETNLALNADYIQNATSIVTTNFKAIENIWSGWHSIVSMYSVN